MFGRKGAIIKQHEGELRYLEGLLNDSELQNEILIKTIRDMDQRLWKMSQQPSWERMQPIFADLMIDVERRMRVESDRIRDLLIPSLKEVYSDYAAKLEAKLKQIGSE